MQNRLPEGLDPQFSVLIDNRLSLVDEDQDIFYRTSAVLEMMHQTQSHAVSGLSFRLDLKDNLDHLTDYRPRFTSSIRANENEFADNRFSLDRAYTGYLTTLKTNLHAGATIGLLEEMYSGTGFEILYRPFRKRYAFGADLWQVFKRDPDSFLETGIAGEPVLTGHLKAWYEIPQSDLTLQASVGRYLGEDVGATIGLQKDFINGVQIKAFATATDQADFDLFGGTTHLYSGLQMTVPLGNSGILPQGSRMTTRIAPFGRQTGQMLDVPLPLYDVTEPLSLRHISDHWSSIID